MSERTTLVQGASGMIVLMWTCASFAPCADAATALDDLALREQAKQAVVMIVAGQGRGSGFVLNQDGFVATNHHVVEGSDQVVVHQGTNEMPASVEWSSRGLDLAVVRAHGRFAADSVVTLALASPDSNSDKDVLAVGFPWISDVFDATDAAVDPTYTDGEVSRDVFLGRWHGRTLQVVQHTAPINGGNSGGPLFDVCGRVIGVNTMGLQPHPNTSEVPIGANFASFVAELARVLDTRQVAYQRSDEPCDVALAGVDGASAEEVDGIRAQLEDVERRMREAGGEQAAALQEQAEQLRRRIDQFEAARRRFEDAQAQSWIMSASVVGGLVVVLLLIGALAFASFRRNILQAVVRAQEGASRLVRPRQSRRTTQPADVPRRSAEYPRRLRIGRGRDMDVVVRSESVSRLHAELRVLEPPDGRMGMRQYKLTDCDSTNGTRVLRSGRWQRIRQDVVREDEQIRFGEYQTTPGALERMARPHQSASAQDDGKQLSGRSARGRPISIAVRRNSAGEVVPRGHG